MSMNPFSGPVTPGQPMTQSGGFPTSPVVNNQGTGTSPVPRAPFENSALAPTPTNSMAGVFDVPSVGSTTASDDVSVPTAISPTGGSVVPPHQEVTAGKPHASSPGVFVYGQTGGAPAPVSQSPSAGKQKENRVWHVGDPVVADKDSVDTPRPFVENRKPVTLPTGEEVSDIPGEPTYTMPGEIRDYAVQRDRYGRYLHTHPVTGVRGSFTRATTIAKKLDSGSNLTDWRDKKIIEGIARYPKLLDGLDVGKMGTTSEYKLRQTFKSIAENAINAAGGADGREFGTALHAWTEALDHGSKTWADVPAAFKPFVACYEKSLSRHGIEVIPEYVERIAYNPIVDTMGTIDRIFRLPTGELVIGDIKTSANIDFAWQSIALQMAQYAHASHILSEDGTVWEEMPKLRTDIAVIASIPHTPKDRGAHCDIYIVNVEYGTKLLYLSRDISQVQHTAKKLVPMALSQQPDNAEAAMEWADAGFAPLATPGANPLAGLENVADDRAQKAVEAMDGDVTPLLDTPGVGELARLTTGETDGTAHELAYVSDLSSVLMRACEDGRLDELADIIGKVKQVSGDPNIATALRVLSSRAGIRASRAATREDTAQAVAARQKSREARAAQESVAVPGGVPDTPAPAPDKAPAVATPQSPFIAVGQANPPAPRTPQPGSAPVSPFIPKSEPQVDVSDEPDKDGIRPHVRRGVMAARTPIEIGDVYVKDGGDWSDREMEFANERAQEILGTLCDSARMRIDAASSGAEIGNLWEEWWTPELVEYARQRINRLG